MIGPGSDEVQQPLKVMEGVKDVSMGEDFTAAITTEDKLYVWGNIEDLLPEDDVKGRSEKVNVMDNVKQVDAGRHFLAVVNHTGELFTWGRDNYGCLGQGIDAESSEDDVREPKKIMDYVQSVSADQETMIILAANGDIYTCGWNYYGQLGDGSEQDQNIPIKIGNIESISESIPDIEPEKIVEEDFFDDIKNLKLNVSGEEQNLNAQISFEKIVDFMNYDGGEIDLAISDGNISLMFKYMIEDGVAESEKAVYVLTKNSSMGGQMMWMGQYWQDVNCQMQDNNLFWECKLPEGSFSADSIQFVGVRIYTSRSREHTARYKYQDGKIEYLDDNSIEDLNLTVSSSDYQQYIQ